MTEIPTAGSSPRPSACVPRSVQGLWRRSELSTPSGFLDVTTEVLWLQTQRLYVDIRLPADRPVRSGARSFQDYTDAELLQAASIQGFAGTLSVGGDVCLWRRALDFQPPGPVPDEARFVLEGETLTEIGIHADYTEIWRREASCASPIAAFAGVDDDGGFLVVAGEHFMEIRPRGSPLPPAPDLGAVVRADLESGRRDLAAERLSMPISYGRVSGAAGPWAILRSTAPWMEGTSLFPSGAEYDPASGMLTAPGSPPRRLDVKDQDPGALKRLFDF